MNNKIIYISLLLLGISGCQHKEDQTPIGMSNPASVYCHQLHGKSKPVLTPQGQYAICILPSGEQIEEWELFRKNHPMPTKE